MGPEELAVANVVEERRQLVLTGGPGGGSGERG